MRELTHYMIHVNVNLHGSKVLLHHKTYVELWDHKTCLLLYYSLTRGKNCLPWSYDISSNVLFYMIKKWVTLTIRLPYCTVFLPPTCSFKCTEIAWQRARYWLAERSGRRSSVHPGWSTTSGGGVIRRHWFGWDLKHAMNRLLIFETRWEFCEGERATQVPLMWPGRVWRCPALGMRGLIWGRQGSARVDRLTASVSRLSRCILIDLLVWGGREVLTTGKERVWWTSAGLWSSDGRGDLG